ncbi:MAG: hypothetical protein BWY52_02768 [Chloroflexi bacterium ADurb.Bin325]|nr:MAG: hypothetical protein BWY52_02768 [Chloroflexi bacterium ADurb.Bin325]
MIRTVPETTGEGIELYIRTYYSLLRSSGDIRIRSLEETHEGMRSSLHLKAESTDFDASAFIYAAMRLPPVMDEVRRVVMGQSEEVFMRGGLRDLGQWRRVDAPARRRRMLFDGHETLAAFVSSVSDIDDLIPCLTAYQIEWNKLHRRLAASQLGHDLADGRTRASDVREELYAALGIRVREDFERLHFIWAARWDEKIRAIAAHPLDIRLNSLASGFNDYRKAVENWWDDLVRAAAGLDVESRPVYFVSSNPHSLPNLLSGQALQRQPEILAFLHEANPENLADEWAALDASRSAAGDDDADAGARANLLYYAQRAYLRGQEDRQREWNEAERAAGVYRFAELHALDIDVQVIELRGLIPARLDPRLAAPGLELLHKSRALIVNVDYPLGFAAYHLLSQVATSMTDLAGVYVMGKAASLNGRVGDVMIPNVVYDEHSRNTFLFKNAFLSQHIAPFLRHGTVFDNQKAVTVRGTFLQNRKFMRVFHQEGYTDLEMEAGPYLSAIYEDIYPRRYPVNEIVNLFINAPYDIGVLHYASDTPYSRRQSLLSKGLSYFGMDATYACSVAIARRILESEVQRVRQAE